MPELNRSRITRADQGRLLGSDRRGMYAARTTAPMISSSPAREAEPGPFDLLAVDSRRLARKRMNWLTRTAIRMPTPDDALKVFVDVRERDEDRERNAERDKPAQESRDENSVGKGREAPARRDRNRTCRATSMTASWLVHSQNCIGGSMVAAAATKAKARSMATGSLGRRRASSMLQASRAVQASKAMNSRAQIRTSRSHWPASGPCCGSWRVRPSGHPAAAASP